MFRSSAPNEALEYAGLVLAHCAAIADHNREGELICPFAVITGSDGRRMVDFESETQQEAVAKGWASLDEARSDSVWWAFGREGIYTKPDGKRTDVLTVSFWLPHMRHHCSVTQCFGRGPQQEFYLIGDPELLEHKTHVTDTVERWNRTALACGIASHLQGARWAEWRVQ